VPLAANWIAIGWLSARSLQAIVAVSGTVQFAESAGFWQFQSPGRSRPMKVSSVPSARRRRMRWLFQSTMYARPSGPKVRSVG
jgi:hypothetical protein